MADTARTQRRLNGGTRILAIAFTVMVAGLAAWVLSAHTALLNDFLPVNHAKSIGSTSAPGLIPAAGNGSTNGGSPLAEAGTEALLAKALAQIKHQRMDEALVEIDKVIAAHPNFRLAHAIKGDLLFAKAGALGAIGGGSDAPQELLDDLREEARAYGASLHRPAAGVGTQIPGATVAAAAPRAGGRYRNSHALRV